MPLETLNVIALIADKESSIILHDLAIANGMTKQDDINEKNYILEKRREEVLEKEKH